MYEYEFYLVDEDWEVLAETDSFEEAEKLSKNFPNFYQIIYKIKLNGAYIPILT